MRSNWYHWCERALVIHQKRNAIALGIASLLMFAMTGIVWASTSYADQLEDKPYLDPRATVVPVYEKGDKTPIAYYVGRTDGTDMLCTRKIGAESYTCIIGN